MKPQPWIIEEELKREREKHKAWEPEPLHAPSPLAPARRPHRDAPEDTPNRGSRVIVIDMASWTSVDL